jgi:uncharacterized damage-inducible protein DinB
MSEKEILLNAWEREYSTTVKVLMAFPKDRLDFRPHERSRSAKELAWRIVSEQPMMVNGVLTGNFNFEESASPPATLREMIEIYERDHAELAPKLKRADEASLNKTVRFASGPGTTGDFRAIDILWLHVMDTVHHRGQFSVYLRMAGGKVPSIYGPTADEPWV